jgi:hypothetical protein
MNGPYIYLIAAIWLTLFLVLIATGLWLFVNLRKRPIPMFTEIRSDLDPRVIGDGPHPRARE